MTIHISYSCPDFVLQAGDRLVTQEDGKQHKEYDANCNKSLYLDIADARVIVSYSGNAYVSGMNTDVWLAKAIIGDAALGDYVTEGGVPRFLALSNVVHQIRDALMREYYTQDMYYRAGGLEIMISGWTLSRVPKGTVPRTIGIHIYAGRSAEEYSCASSPHRLRWASNAVLMNKIQFAAIGSLGDYPSHLHQAYQPLFDDPNQITEQSITRILVEEIRHIAALPTVQTVGREIMLFSLCWDKPPSITFYRDESIVHGPSTTFGPWVINTRLGYNLKPAKIVGDGLQLANTVSSDGTVRDWLRIMSSPPYPGGSRVFDLRRQTRKSF